MKSLLNGRFKLALGATLVLGALCFLGFDAFQGATVYYFEIEEVLHQKTPGSSETFRVNGKLVSDSFHREQNTLMAEFSLTDGNNLLPAQFDGVVPDLFFNDHSEIILEGHYTEQGVFHASSVVVKCPSKYVASADNEAIYLAEDGFEKN